MAQVSYGTITITDTTDLTTYIRYATKAPLTAVSQFQETPTTDTRYIAVLSIPTSDSIPAWNSSSWKWSEFIGTDGLSVKDTRVLYYLKTNSVNVPQIDENTPIVSTDTQNVWTSKNPTYVANGTYWTCLEVTLSDNTTKSWSAPAEDLGLTQAAKDAAETKSIAQHANEDAQGALGVARAMQQNFWWWGEDQTVDSSFTLPAGAYTSDIKKDAFKANPTGGYLVTRSDGVYLNNGRYVLMGLTGNALKFYRPGTTKLLSGTETIDAQLDSNGLVLSKGGIKAGTPNSKGFIYLSSEDYLGNITINNHNPLEKYTEVENPEGNPKEKGWYEKNEEVYTLTEDTEVQQGKVYYQDESDPKWRQIIGNKFGVDSEGNLYAASARIGSDVKIGNETKYHISLADNEIAFWSGEESISVNKTAYITGNYMYIPYTVVLNEMRVGQGDSQAGDSAKWSWRYIESSENLRLVWLGGEGE